MKQYKHIFFDLDRTLWDFEQNSYEVLQEIYTKHQLQEKGIPSFDDFYNTYHKINHDLWDLYRVGKITKEFLNLERFYATIRTFGIQEETTAKAMGHDYVSLSPYKKALFPGTHELLSELKKKYKLHLITNGFAEVQTTKIKESELDKYFNEVIISETTPWKKPRPEIFEYSLNKANAKAEESMMVGDDINADIKGAAAVGMDQIWTNFTKSTSDFIPTFMVENLLDILKIL
jgi:putative hydrolase of the HAD superfamily